ncbi:MAG: membrane protein insertase YidC, partial [Chthoniobacterales bacterium]
MDRQAWVAVTLCAIGLVFYVVYTSQHPPQVVRPPLATASPSASAPEVATASPAAPRSDIAPAPAPEATPAPATAPAFEEKIETLRNSDVELRLTNRGGGISEVHLLNHQLEKDRSDVILNSPDRLPIGAIVENPAAPALAEFIFAQLPDGSAQYERATTEGLSIRKRFLFPPTPDKKDNYVAEMQVDFRNDDAQPRGMRDFFIALGSTMPIHPRDMPANTRLLWCINGSAKAIDVNWFSAQKYPFVGVEKRPAQEIYQEKVNAAEWAAMSNQFFTTIITPLNAKVSEAWGRRFDVKTADGSAVLGLEGAMGLAGFQLQPGETSTLKFQIYAGPKLYGRLAQLPHDEAEVMNFGFFKLVSQALLNFLNLLHRWVGSYGVAIILLTACVKGVLWPLQNKANKSMRRMSALAPKMQELKEKYKDDPTKMNAEVMKLYKEHGVNPVGGCLPMMIQIPIFFGLFSMLGQVAELRNATFLWVKDLSQPDTLFVVKGLGWIPILGTPGIGLTINLLPIIMGASNVWLMRMTPKTGDTTQQRVMMFMPIIFLVFCYNFAAALALYYTTQNLFTILQLW